MIITVGCPSCGHRYDIAGKLAGKRVRCKECATTFRVPVPVTMPVSSKEPRRRKKKLPVEGIEGSIFDILEAAAVDTSAPPEVREPTGGLISDVGERWWYLMIQGICLAGLIGLGSAAYITPLRALIWISLLCGGFLLIPILCGWESFERSWKARVLTPALGSEGAKAVFATIAVAFWVLAVLLAIDTIHLEVLSR
jgi:hypothetical protein